MAVKQNKYPQIKLCGIRTLEDLQALAEGAVPDYIGLVFAKSKRQITVEQAQIIVQGLHERKIVCQTVGVFVNEPLEHLLSILQKVPLEVVQLHGEEDQTYLDTIKRYYPEVKVWKAYRIQDAKSFEAAHQLKCDQFLWDAYQETCYGGTGHEISREWLVNYEKVYGRAYFLAGGLNLDNLKVIAGTLNPLGVDISSGIETAGKKDAEKIKAIIKQIREELVWSK